MIAIKNIKMKLFLSIRCISGRLWAMAKDEEYSQLNSGGIGLWILLLSSSVTCGTHVLWLEHWPQSPRLASYIGEQRSITWFSQGALLKKKVRRENDSHIQLWEPLAQGSRPNWKPTDVEVPRLLNPKKKCKWVAMWEGPKAIMGS